MTFQEANVLFDVINQDNQFRWEMERMNWFYIGMWDRNKVKKPIDLIRFSWENQEEMEQSKEDIETTKQRLLELMNRV